MNLPLSLVNPSHLVTSLICIALGGLFATLFSAYHFAGETGIPRLCEKFRKLAPLLTRWEPHWDLLRIALLLVTMAFEVGAITFSVLALSGLGDTYAFVMEMALIPNLLLFVLALDLLPRVLSESYADRLISTSLRPVSLLALPLLPVAWPLAALERFLFRRIMAHAPETDRPTPEDEIRSLVEQSDEADLEPDEKDMIRSVFEFADTTSREIMTPRVDVVGFDRSEPIHACLAVTRQSPHSRFPVYDETLDDILGFIHVKDLMRALLANQQDQPVGSIAKDATFVPESMPINDLLAQMRRARTQLVVVVDEYGGTSGLVSMEDIIEELVGEIRDEYDLHEETRLQRLSDGSLVVDARLPVDEVNKSLHIQIPESEEYDSLGGYVFQILGRIPRPGEQVEGEDHTVVIQTANAHRILTARVIPTAAQPQ